MRRLLTLAAIVWAVAAVSAQAPSWINNKPDTQTHYVGVGIAPSSDPQKLEKSKQAALADLVSDIQISVKSSVNQQLRQENEVDYEKFEMDVATNSEAYLEGAEPVGTYDDGKFLWTCYRLSHAAYAATLKRRTEEAAARSSDFCSQASSAANSANFASALALYMQGLDIAAPFARYHLMHNGTDVVGALTGGAMSLLSGVGVTLNPTEATVAPMSRSAVDVVATVASANTPVAGAKVTAQFMTGEGHITDPTPTNAQGKSTFSVSDIASRTPSQKVKVTADLSALLAPYKGTPAYDIIAKSLTAMPQAVLTINVPAQTLTAFCAYTNGYSDPAVLRAISSFLTANYFDLAPSADKADVKVKVAVEYTPGGVVKGEMYDMREGFISCQVKVVEAASGNEIAAFGVDGVRSLSKATASADKMRIAAQRELIRKLRPVMKRRMQQTTITPRPNPEADSDDDED